jgi:hypothetical protein
MENSNDNNLGQKNQSYGSSDSDSGNPQSVMDGNENRYDSHSENQPKQSGQITNEEQDRNSYKNHDGNRSEENDFDETEENEENEEDNDVDDQDLDENGFPRSKDSSFPSNI